MPLVSQPEGQHQLHSMGLWGMCATVWQFGKRKGGGYWASDQKRRVLPVTCDWAPGKLLQGWKMRHPIKSAKCRSFSPILAVGSSSKLLPPQFRDLYLVLWVILLPSGWCGNWQVLTKGFEGRERLPGASSWASGLIWPFPPWSAPRGHAGCHAASIILRPAARKFKLPFT